MLLFSSFHPLIKHAEPTQLWNVWLSELSNQNHAAFLRQSLEAPTGSRISRFYSLREKMKRIFLEQYIAVYCLNTTLTIWIRRKEPRLKM